MAAVVRRRSGRPSLLFRRVPAPNQQRLGSAGGDGPTRLVRIDPFDGALGVLRDTPILARFSRAVSEWSLEPGVFRVAADRNEVRGTLRLSPDGRVLIWRAERPLAPDTVHSVEVQDLRDQRGEPVEVFSSAFATGALILSEVLV